MVWLILQGAQVFGGRGVLVDRLAVGLAAFWSIALASLAAGWIIATTIGVSGPANGRDAIALAFVAAITCALAASPARGVLVERTVVVLLFATGVAAVGVFVAVLVGRRLAFGGVDLLYQGFRLRGWSDNPNQLALLLLPVPSLALGAVARWSSRIARVLVIAVGGAAVPLGLATGSDALMLAWLAGGVGAAVFYWVASVVGPQRNLGRAVALRLVGPIVAVAVVIGLAGSGLRWVESRIERTFLEGRQGKDRVDRWRHGFEAASTSVVFGLGPGAFSGKTGPFQGQEAHSTLVDWAASTGLVGMFALVVLGVVIGAVVLASRDWIVIWWFGSLAVFLALHYMLRHPLVWFQLVAIAQLGWTSFKKRNRPPVHPSYTLSPA